MPKPIPGMLLLTSLLLMATPTWGADEKPISGTLFLSVQSKVLRLGEERRQVTYEATGIYNPAEGILSRGAIHCLGALETVHGEYKDAGSCVISQGKDSQVFLTYTSTGKPGSGANGAWQYVGGTGRFVGLGGSGTSVRTVTGRATEDTLQTLSEFKGTTIAP